MKIKNIFFRVDGYKKIGYGHLMRSLTLAQEFIKNKYNVKFISYNDNFLKQKLKEANIGTILINSKAGSNRDLKSVIKIFGQSPDNIFIYDNYNINIEYEKEIKKYTKLLVAIDDEAKRKFLADIIINQNYGAEKYKYKLVNKNSIVLAGIKYVLLRDEILKNRRKKINKKVKNILITFGGSDYFNQSLRIVKILQNNIGENIKLNVVVNENYMSLKKLQEIVRKNKQIILWNNVKEMGKLMKEMDLTISAAGSTVWELLYIGVPTLLMIIADNQKDIARNLSKDGYMENLGWYNKISDKEILDKIMELINDKQKRERLFKQGQKLIDGRGKKRIVKEVIKKL